MQYTKSLSRAIEMRDVSLARAALITYADNDATCSELIALKIADEVNRRFEAFGKSLYDSDNANVPLVAPENADAKIWNKVKAALHLNFSREKIMFASEVVRALRHKNAVDFLPKDKADTLPRMPKTQQNYAVRVGKSEFMSCGFNKPLEKAIGIGDISLARAAIITHIDSDYHQGTAIALSVADRAQQDFLRKGKSIFEPDNGNISFFDRTWNESLWNKTKAALHLNFSREKVEFATELIKNYNSKFSRRPSLENMPTKPLFSPRNSSKGRPKTSVHRVKSHNNTFVAGLVVGGVVGGIVGAYVGAAVVGVVVGAAVVGGATYNKQK